MSLEEKQGSEHASSWEAGLQMNFDHKVLGILWHNDGIIHWNALDVPMNTDYRY